MMSFVMAIQRIVLFVCMFVSFCFEIIKRLIYWKETISSKLKCQNNKKKICYAEKKQNCWSGFSRYFLLLPNYILLYNS